MSYWEWSNDIFIQSRVFFKNTHSHSPQIDEILDANAATLLSVLLPYTFQKQRDI